MRCVQGRSLRKNSMHLARRKSARACGHPGKVAGARPPQAPDAAGSPSLALRVAPVGDRGKGKMRAVGCAKKEQVRPTSRRGRGLLAAGGVVALTNRRPLTHL
eukprot:scaffold3135_cov352-Prasinococcus_capsulatus_cf.AAC.3